MGMDDVMRPLKSILVVLPAWANSRLLVDRAAALAKAHVAELTVLEVIQTPQETRFGAPPGEDLHRNALRKRREGLVQTTLSARRIGVEANVEVRVGNRYHEIIQEVLSKDHDLLIVSDESTLGIKERVFGSPMKHLLRDCPCPVWVMKQPLSRAGRRVLAAINPLASDEEHRGLDTAVLGTAALLAHRESLELHIVHVWRMYGESILRSPRSGMSKAEVNEMVRDQRRECQRKVLLDLQSCPATHLLDYQLHFIKGDACSRIPRLASRLGIDVIVLGTAARRGLPGLIVGNTAEKILSSVDCSVVTVKPEGFLSRALVDGH